MKNLTINLPDEIYKDLIEVAESLGQTVEEVYQMAISLLIQSDSIDYALIAMERAHDGVEAIEPLLKEEMDEDIELKIKFHPLALIELNQLNESKQIEILSELIEHLIAEEEFDGITDLVINEKENAQIILSRFHFGDIIYKITDSITIYLLGMPVLEEKMMSLLGDEKKLN